MTEWQPIETAPISGLILLAVTDGNEWRTFAAERSTSADGDHWETTTGWVGYRKLHSAWTPTHWMPLPPPPAP